MSDWTDVGSPADLPLGEAVVVEVDDVPVLVVNLDGEFVAYEDLCSHEALPIANGKIADERLVCPHHGAEFCLRTGAALTAPAYEGLTALPVRVHEGRVQVRDDRWD